MKELLFKTEQVLNVTQMSLATLKEYIRYGLIKPHTQGRQNFYSFKNIVQLHLITLLIHNKISRVRIKEISPAAEQLFKKTKKDDPFSIEFDPSGQDSFLKIETIDSQNELMIVINFTQIHIQVKRKLMAIGNSCLVLQKDGCHPAKSANPANH